MSPDPKPIDERDIQLAGQIAAIQVIIEIQSKSLERIDARLASIELSLCNVVPRNECTQRHKPLTQYISTWGQLILIIAAIFMGYLKLHGLEIKQPAVVATPIPPQAIVIRHEYPQTPDAGILKKKFRK